MIRVINTVIHIITALLIFFSDDVYCQSSQSVTGFITDKETGLPVAGALVTTSEYPNDDARSDSTGQFLIYAEHHSFILVVSHPEYIGLSLRFDVLSDTLLLIPLERQFILKEITVTALRLPQVTSMIPSSVTVIPRERIEQSNYSSLANVVAPLAGVFVKDYGSMSGLKTISQRGLGTEHTLILLNGMRVSSQQNGLIDLGLLPSDQIESVEVVRGGQSASYGADAVAGVINIITRAPSHQYVSASNSLGSFGYRRFQVVGDIGSDKNGARVSYGEERSAEDFPFHFHNGSFVSDLSRINADVIARFGSLQGSVPIAEHTHVDGLIWLYGSERGVGGPVLSPFSASLARETDREHLLQMVFSSEPSETFRFSFHSQARYSFQRYRDPDLNIAGVALDTEFKNVDFQLEPQAEFTIGNSSRLAVGVEIGRTIAEGSSIRSDIKRTQTGVFTVGEIAMLEGSGIISRLVAFPAFRYDAIASMPGSWSPQIGMLLSFNEFNTGYVEKMKIGIRASLSRNFRAPTFNELYYTGGGGYGNPSLKPERSISFDAGMELSFSMLGEHSLQTSYFLINMADRIVWVAAAAGSVTPKNLHNIRSEGMEASYRWSLFANVLSVEANYTLVESKNTSPGDPNEKKQLIYIPQEILNLSLVTTKHFESSIIQQISGTVTQSFTGYRYMSEDNAVFLPSYHITDVGLRAKVTIGEFAMFTKLEANNLFNEDYQVIIGYPMPLRSYRFTVGVEY